MGTGKATDIDISPGNLDSSLCLFQPSVSHDVLLTEFCSDIRFCVISVPLDDEIFAPCFMSLFMFQCLLVYSLWELE